MLKTVLSVKLRESATFSAPLFACLEDSDSTKRYLNESELQDSIKNEIYNLLNTRSFDVFFNSYTELNQNTNLLPFQYGISIDSIRNNNGNMLDFCERLQDAIYYYEPRLINPKVTFRSFNINKQELCLEIYGDIEVASVFEHVFFPITLNTG